MTSTYDKQREKVTPPQIGLKDLRNSHRLTQADVASQVAAIIDKPFYSGSLSLIEGGHRGASAEVLRALEQIFGLATDAMTVAYEPSHDRRLRAVSE